MLATTLRADFIVKLQLTRQMQSLRPLASANTTAAAQLTRARLNHPTHVAAFLSLTLVCMTKPSNTRTRARSPARSLARSLARTPRLLVACCRPKNGPIFLLIWQESDAQNKQVFSSMQRATLLIRNSCIFMQRSLHSRTSLINANQQGARVRIY